MGKEKKYKANLLIPMAGLGKRFSDAGYKIAKPFLPLGEDSMIEAVVKNLYHDDLHFIFVVNNKTADIKELKSRLDNILLDYNLLEIDYLPQGAAMSCMVAKDLINNDTPLITADCDMVLEDWDFERFNKFCEFHQPEGVIGTFFSLSPKNSFVKLNDKGEVIEAKEKVVISDLATNGLRYWRKGKYLVDAVEKMVENNDVVNGEYYVAPSYNYMLAQGMKIMPYHFNMHFPVGIPEDYEFYKKKKNL